MSEVYLTGITAFLAAIVAWTGYQQHKLSKENLKLALFKKRLFVYQGVQTFLNQVITTGTAEKKYFTQLAKSTQDAAFLFDSEISEYIAAIRNKSLKMRTVQKKLENMNNVDERNRLIDEDHKLFTELNDELLELDQVFMPYLKFSKWI
jgi:hypothetical protein